MRPSGDAARKVEATGELRVLMSPNEILRESQGDAGEASPARLAIGVQALAGAALFV
jgi:hypothetical protein